jgi:hypothetical protein
MKYVICINNDGLETKFDIGKTYKYRISFLSNWAGGIPENDAFIVDNFGKENLIIKPLFNKKFELIDLSKSRIEHINKILDDFKRATS